MNPPGASTIRAEEAERRLAEMEAMMKKSAGAASSTPPPPSPPGASTIRAEQAERRLAEMEAMMKRSAGATSSTPPSPSPPGASTIRAEQAERRLAEMEAMMKRSAGATSSTPPPPSPPGASTIRAEQAEKRVAELEVLMRNAAISKSKPREVCSFYVKKGSCRYGDSCRLSHAPADIAIAMNKQLELKARELEAKLASKDRELEKAKQFSKLREDMSAQVTTMQEKFQELLKRANSLDLVLCMDLTGSMAGWISTAQTQLCSIIDEVKRAHENVIVRVAFVGYRDHCDGADRLVQTNFSSDAEAIKTVIKAQTAKGGGDDPEDVTGGLKAALELPWQADARSLVLICDAPCHFPKYHNSHNSQDSSHNLQMARELYKKDDYIEDIVKNLATTGIDFNIIEILPLKTTKMTTIMKDVYSAAPRPHDGVERKINVIPMENGHTDATKLGITVARVASSSVSDSKLRAKASIASTDMICRVLKGGVSSIHHYGPTLEKKRSSSVATGSGLHPYRFPGKPLTTIAEMVDEDASSLFHLRKSTLDWNRLDRSFETERARRYTYLFRPGAEIDWDNPDLKLVTQETTIKIDSCYFADGAMRTAHTMYDGGIEKRLVAKVYKPEKKVFKNANERKELVEQDVKAQSVAKYLAMLFSTHDKSIATVDFIYTSYYELLDRPKSHPMKFVSAEPYVEGEYKKYNNNNGWASTEFSDTAQAFSHYSWQETMGSLMVVDLQGVNYILTDPQIHTRTGVSTSFGLGNLGTDGMTAFFCTHVCNPICHHMRLLEFVSTAKGKSTIRKELSDKADTTTATASSVSTPIISPIANLSCVLCGDIFCIARLDLMEKIKVSNTKFIYCESCNNKVHKHEHRKRVQCGCGKGFDYSPYFYLMIGMEPPKTCRDCKDRAAAARHSK